MFRSISNLQNNPPEIEENEKEILQSIETTPIKTLSEEVNYNDEFDLDKLLDEIEYVESSASELDTPENTEKFNKEKEENKIFSKKSSEIVQLSISEEDLAFFEKHGLKDIISDINKNIFATLQDYKKIKVKPKKTINNIEKFEIKKYNENTKETDVKDETKLVIEAVMNSSREFFEMLKDKLDINALPNNAQDILSLLNAGLNSGEILLRNLPKAFRENKDLVAAALEFNEEQFEFASSLLRGCKEFILQLIQNGISVHFLKYMSTKLSDEDQQAIFYEAIKRNGAVLEYCGKFLSSKSFILKSLRINPTICTYVYWFIDAKLWENHSFAKYRDKIYDVVSECNLLAEELEKVTINNAEIIKSIHNGEIIDFGFIGHEFRAEKEVMLAAMTQDGLNLEYVTDTLKKDREIVECAVRNNGCALQFALFQDKEIALEAVKNDGSALKFVKEKSKEIINAALENDPKAFEFLDFQIQVKMTTWINVETEEAHFFFKDLETTLSKKVKNNPAFKPYIYDEYTKDWVEYKEKDEYVQQRFFKKPQPPTEDENKKENLTTTTNKNVTSNCGEITPTSPDLGIN